MMQRMARNDRINDHQTTDRKSQSALSADGGSLLYIQEPCGAAFAREEHAVEFGGQQRLSHIQMMID